MKQYLKYNPETHQVTEYAPRNKGGILNYNSPNNHQMLIADGYSFEEVENGYIAGHAPIVPDPSIEEQNEIIRQTRANEYTRLIDPLHAEKARKEVLEEWSPELEVEYRQKVIDLTAQIKTEHPYITESEVMLRR